MIFTARKNLRLEVSDRQVQILVGCLLGDAYLTKLGKIQIEQSKKDYTDWKFQELASISYPNPPKEVIRLEKRDNRAEFYKSYRFWTGQYFRIWRDIWYQNGCKIFPKALRKWITPLSIAVWYMDDGSFDKKSNCILSTESFDGESRLALVEVLAFFGVEAKPDKDGMSRIRLRLKSKCLFKFFELIRPYIHESMRYKLP